MSSIQKKIDQPYVKTYDSACSLSRFNFTYIKMINIPGNTDQNNKARGEHNKLVNSSEKAGCQISAEAKRTQTDINSTQQTWHQVRVAITTRKDKPRPK